jgi:MarR family transcriptional regulator, organic hydroperoxide resistance regulator
MNAASKESPRLPPLGDVLDFLRLIWAIDHRLQSTSKRMELTLGVTGPQRLVVRLLGRFPGLTSGQLAEALRVHPSTITGIVQRLEQKGLVNRRTDPRDKRRAFLGLTSKGRGLDVDTVGTIEAALSSILKKLPPKKIVAAREVLEALALAMA